MKEKMKLLKLSKENIIYPKGCDLYISTDSISYIGGILFRKKEKQKQYQIRINGSNLFQYPIELGFESQKEADEELTRILEALEK